MNNYIKAHKKLWNKIIRDIRFGRLSTENYIDTKGRYYLQVSHEFNIPETEYDTNCFLCDLFYSHGYVCSECKKMFNLSESPNCLSGLYDNFLDALYYDRVRAIRLAKIIRDLYKTADLSVFDE